MVKPDKKLRQDTFTHISSPVVTVSTEIELEDIATDRPHCFVGAQFFSDASGSTPVVPGAGTVTITIQTTNNKPVFEPPVVSVIQAAASATVSWSGNTERVKAAPSGITVATHYRIVVTCNKT